MTTSIHAKGFAFNVGNLLTAGMLLIYSLPIFASETDLADIPLTNATTTTMLPNIAFMYDDSGSMDDENMPDDDGTNKTKYCWKYYKYNTLAYNPAVTYLAPIKADGTRYADATFTAALKDGYFASGVKMYDGSTTNSAIDLTSLGTVTTTKANVVFPDFGTSKHYASSVKVTQKDGSTVQLMGTDTKVPDSSNSNEDTVGAAVRDAINLNTATTGYSATYNNTGNVLTIYAPSNQNGLTTTPSITLVNTTGSLKSVTSAAFSDTTVPGNYYSTNTVNPDNTTCEADGNYSRVTSASSIAAPGKTTGSEEAKTNYANWYSFYRKRAFMAKAAAGEAFASLDHLDEDGNPKGKYRVGLFFIESKESESDQTETNNDLKIDTFTGSASGTHRANWFDRLYNSRQALYTPLRGALSRMGRMYAGKISGWDPVQYSCQRNFTILTTDGYWNTQAETTTSPKYGPYREDNSTLVGDQDGVTGTTRPTLDSSKVNDTLADVAYYYYKTDLRPASLGAACTTADGFNVCTDNVPPVGTDDKVDDVAQHQHMTTFTIGLGVNGTLVYQDGYKTSTSGDYFDIKQGTKNWPDPFDGDAEKIDDLWHAAVNGRGTYFSAKNTDSFVAGLLKALGSIESSAGSGAAAATSNLQPTAGDNYIYIANYQTVKWDGELSAYTIDLLTGALSANPVWQASTKLDAKIGSAGDTDTRTIYTSDSSGLKLFLYDDPAPLVAPPALNATEKAYFDEALDGDGTNDLSQYADWSTADKTAATGASLVNYLRGQHRLEDQDRDIATFGAYNRLYRDRAKTLGDIVHSQPVFVKGTFYNFADTGYAAFKADNNNATTGRAGSVYVAANDGMLHAFNDTDGTERWAYVPPLVMKNMWRLADKNYSTNHQFFIDGPIAVSDFYDTTDSSWKTILVGAMGKGGRGYYALDITSPTTPKVLWTYTADDNPNMGYSYGTPMITKMPFTTTSGTTTTTTYKWVVLLASGYNNIPEDGSYLTADGKGYLFALNAATGAVEKTWSTGVGTTTTPSGLARINIRVADFEVDNTMTVAYGGDLEGNMWRFSPDDANGTPSTPSTPSTPHKVIALGSTRPITVTPEIGEVDGKTLLFFGTGRFLGEDDLDDEETGGIYGIWDNGSHTILTTELVKQTISGTSIVTTDIDWATQYGWYVDFGSDSKERVNLGAQLYFGTLIVASTIPDATECQPGGYSKLYFLDYATGETLTAVQTITSPIVGITVAKLPGGTPKVYIVKSDKTKPEDPTTMPLNTSGGGGLGSGRRVMWRELVN